MNDVCWKIVHAKTLASPDGSQMKFGVLSENWPISPHLEWRKQPRRNGVYQTNDGNDRKSCTVFVRVHASVDNADTGKGNQRRRTKKWEAGEDGGRPNPGGSLREENSQTDAHRADLHSGMESKNEKQFYILSYTLLYLDIERSLQGQTRRRI